MWSLETAASLCVKRYTFGTNVIAKQNNKDVMANANFIAICTVKSFTKVIKITGSFCAAILPSLTQSKLFL